MNSSSSAASTSAFDDVSLTNTASIDQTHSKDSQTSQTRFSFYNANGGISNDISYNNNSSSNNHNLSSPSMPPRRFQYYQPIMTDSAGQSTAQYNSQTPQQQQQQRNDGYYSSFDEDRSVDTLQKLRGDKPSTPSQRSSKMTVDTQDLEARPSWRHVRTPPEADRLLRTRERYSDSGTTPRVGSDGQNGSLAFTDMDSSGSRSTRHSNTPSNYTGTPQNANYISEGIQADIEARRKSRQKRMAQYANRLAQLKQDDEPTPTSMSSLAWQQSSRPPKNVDEILMAVLERANTGNEEKKLALEEADTEAVIAAMSNLVLQLSGSQSISNSRGASMEDTADGTDTSPIHTTSSSRASYYYSAANSVSISENTSKSSPTTLYNNDSTESNNTFAQTSKSATAYPNLDNVFQQIYGNATHNTSSEQEDDELDELMHKTYDSDNDDDEDAEAILRSLQKDDDDDDAEEILRNLHKDDDEELEQVVHEVMLKETTETATEKPGGSILSNKSLLDDEEDDTKDEEEEDDDDGDGDGDDEFPDNGSEVDELDNVVRQAFAQVSLSNNSSTLNGNPAIPDVVDTSSFQYKNNINTFVNETKPDNSSKILSGISGNNSVVTASPSSPNYKNSMKIEVCNDDDAHSELDKMVLNVNSNSNSRQQVTSDDPIDRRIRSVISQQHSRDKYALNVAQSSLEVHERDAKKGVEVDDEEDDDDSINSSDDEDIVESSFVSSGIEIDDDDEDDEDETLYGDDDDEDDDIGANSKSNQPRESVQRTQSDGVLGPLSRKSGGTTGVVLEHNSTKKRQLASPSILESMSAVMNMMTRGLSPKQDRSVSYEDSVDEDEQEAHELMRNLCAHLLPYGVDCSSQLLDKLPAWDESNPDEPGYRIVRLTRSQLDAVERSFDKMLNFLKNNSENNLAIGEADDTFERDLQAAEELLDMEERRLKAAENALNDAEKTSSNVVNDFDNGYRGVNESDCLSDFPGVKPAGRGEMGDLEFFQLPIIFKSHVTGFEPTKDLFLEQGNIIAGQYLVERELGSAAFSTAYRCVDLNSDGDGPDDHEEVCLKVIKNTKDFFDQSLDEIKILELLRQTGKCHENCIIEMRSFFYYREHLFIVTELLRQNLFEFGKSIIDNNEEPYFTLPRLGYITRQCLIALKFVHGLGLVHSDIKPENILLASYSRAKVKVIDFGSSCYLTDRQSSYIQSRSYRAPEVVLGLPYDGRIDIWSLGCVVAEMFTGEVTFQNDSVVSMLSRIEAICGSFPRHMVAQGRQSDRFFTKCGLLYENVHDGRDRRDQSGDHSEEESESDADGEKHVDIFQPKITCLASRLGFSPELMELYDEGKKLTKEEKLQALFVDFVRKLLAIDPDNRPTAAEALGHPWIQYAANLTEDDIKYPSN